MDHVLLLTDKIGKTKRKLKWDWRDLFSLRPTFRREKFIYTHPLPDGNLYFHFEETCLAFGPIQWVKVEYIDSTHD